MAKTKARPKIQAPVVATLVPAAAPLGSPSFTLHVYGAGFVDGDVILWNNSPEPTTFVSAHQLTTGVNMETAEVVMPIPVGVQTVDGKKSNVVTFALGEAVPPLPSFPAPDGFVLMMDAYARPILVRVDEIAGIEESIETGDASGPLYGKNPATAYRRLTLRSGTQFFVGLGSLVPVMRALRSEP